MKKLLILFAFTILGITSFSQNRTQWFKYANVQFMRSTPGGDYGKFLKDQLSKVAQKRIDDGTIVGWQVWGVGNATSESKYDMIVITFANSVDSLYANNGLKILGIYNDAEVKTMQDKINTSRKNVESIMLANKNGYSFIDTTAKYAVFNYMKTLSGGENAYEKEIANLTTSITKPSNSGRLAWSLNTRIDVIGEDVQWNYASADFFNTLANMMESRAVTSPDNAAYNKISTLRQMKKSEVVYNIHSLIKK